MQRRVAILAVFVALGSLLVLIATKLNPESRPEWRARTIPNAPYTRSNFTTRVFKGNLKRSMQRCKRLSPMQRGASG
jgi:hypothetical protein